MQTYSEMWAKYAVRLTPAQRALLDWMGPPTPTGLPWVDIEGRASKYVGGQYRTKRFPKQIALALARKEILTLVVENMDAKYFVTAHLG